MYKEKKLIKRYWKCYPHNYYRYDLYRKDKSLTKQQILDYIPEFFFFEVFLPFYNNYKKIEIIENKNMLEILFRSLSIKQPFTVGKIMKNNLFNLYNEKINFNMISKEIEEKKFKKIFIKPCNGKGGYGIYIFNREDGVYRDSNKITLNSKFLEQIGENTDYIIQGGIEQCKELKEIYPDSVNSFRIITENKNGNVRILRSVLRVGKSDNEVDNICQGGIMLPIDIETGKISDNGSTYDRECFTKHPDTCFVFKGYKLSFWYEVKKFALESASKLPQITYLGWDIAMSIGGPLAIETNIRYGFGRLSGLSSIYNINDPKYYYKKMGVRK